MPAEIQRRRQREVGKEFYPNYQKLEFSPINDLAEFNLCVVNKYCA